MDKMHYVGGHMRPVQAMTGKMFFICDFCGILDDVGIILPVPH